MERPKGEHFLLQVLEDDAVHPRAESLLGSRRLSRTIAYPERHDSKEPALKQRDPLAQGLPLCGLGDASASACATSDVALGSSRDIGSCERSTSSLAGTNPGTAASFVGARTRWPPVGSGVGRVGREVGRVGLGGAEVDHVADRRVAGDQLVACSAGASAGEAVSGDGAEAVASGVGVGWRWGAPGPVWDAGLHRSFLANAGTSGARRGYALSQSIVLG